ncbi:MAG: PIN domain-containing protein [Chitinispirillales bacterium]|nr:PIN domain-containing protein [Chitinispirillales bacterium]
MKRYFIDSNILIFYMSEDDDDISAEVQDILSNHNNLISIPSRCVEEVIHLQQSGKIRIKQWKSAEDIVDFITDELNFGIKHTGNEHLRTLAKLPLFPDHKDPIDRIAIAQAITEKTGIISSDTKFHYYKKYGLDLVFNKRGR